MIKKEQNCNSILKHTGKIFYLVLVVFFLFPGFSFSQSCECTDCPGTTPANAATDFEFLIGGAVNNDLSSAGQGVCGVVIEFIPDHIWSLEMVLTSPGGQQVTLIGPPVNTFGFTGPFAWEITFLPCGEAVSPDPGFNPTWDNDQPWALGALYSGSYYPNSGCLEDFDLGSVDGIWTLSVNNTSPVNTADILDFSVIFCDDEGLNCFECEANAGGFQDTSAIVACAGDPSLVLNLDPVYSGSDPDTSIYGYTYIISQGDTILSYDTLPDLTGLGGGFYKINGFAYRIVDTIDIPPPDGNTTVSSLNQNLIDFSNFFCGDVTDTCLTVTIIEIDTTFLIDTLCAGDSFIFGVDTIYTLADTIVNGNDTTFIAADTMVTSLDTLTASGVYTFNYESVDECDSTVVFDLTIRDAIETVLFDTICAEDTYLFDGEFYDTSGVYTAIHPAESLCDSTVTLNLFVKDSIITNLTAVICVGESYTVGNNDYSSTGISTDVFNSVENCDSFVILDLTVLDPTVSIVLPTALSCNDSTVILDGSGSTGEALTFEWFHLDNGNDGIISGEDSAIAVVNKTGNYLLVVTDTLGGNECVVANNVGVGADINPPHIIALGGSIDCNDDQVQLTGISITPGAVFNWTGPNNFETDEPNPFVDEPGDYTLLITGPNGCESESTVSVDVDTIPPDLTLAVSDTLDCNITIVQLSAFSAPQATEFNWTGPNNFSSDQQNPNTDFPGEYTVIAETPNGCTSEAAIIVEQNIGTPDAAAIGDTLTCTVLVVQLEGSSITLGVTYSWTGPNNFTSNIQNPFAAAPGEYFLTVQAPNGCETTVSTFIEQDIETPDASAVGDTLNCNISIAQLFGNSTTPDVSFSWIGPNNFVSDLQNPEATVSGEYFLTVQSNDNGCITTVSTMVEEDFEAPDISGTGGTIDCNNSTVQLQGSSSISGVIYSWTGPNNFTSDDQNPIVNADGDYTLFVVGPNGCESQLGVVVEMDTLPPSPSISVSDTLDCNITSVQLFGNSIPAASAYNWTGPNTFISDEQNPTTDLPGVYNLVVTIANGCTNETMITVIEDIETPDASATGDTLNCNILIVQLEGNSTTPDVEYSWTGPNNFTSNDQNPLVSNPGEYFLTVQAENGCETTVSTMVEEDVEVPDISVLGDTLNCDSLTAQLQGNSLTPDVEYSWTGPNNFTSDEQNPTVDNAGVYTLFVLANNGCESSDQVTIEIDTLAPELPLTVDDTLDCNVSVVQLFSNANPLAVLYEWTGPNNFSSDEQNPIVSEPGEYSLIATNQNGCSNEVSIIVEQDSDVPDATAFGDTLNCYFQIVQILGVSSTPDVTYSWIGPNNFMSDQQNPFVSVPGEYFLTVEGASGCGFTTSTMVLEDIAIPDATAIGDTLFCSDLMVQLQGNSITLDVTYSWAGPNNFSSDEQNPEVNQPGEYFLTVEATNGCDSTVSVMVDEDVDAPDATAIGDTLNCTVLIGQLQGNSTTSDVTYSWIGPNNFSSDEQNPEVTAPGEYFLTIETENGCETTVSAMVELDNEIPDALAIGDTLDCNSSMVQLQGISMTPGVSYSWTGPNNFISSLQNPFVTVPGEYFLTVQAPNGCEATESAMVEQDAGVPDVSATVSDTLDCNTLVVELQGNSMTPEVVYSWTGPNNFESDDQNPEVSEPGEYSLTITSPNGCQAIIDVEVYENVELPDAFAISDSLDCNNTVAQLQGNSTTIGVSYNWIGPSSFESDEQDPQVTESGEYFLTVNALNGCETTVSTFVEEDVELPDAVAMGDTLNCVIFIAQLQGNSSTPGIIYSWTGPNNFESDEQNPEVTEPGEYFLTVLAENGCETIVNAIVEEDTEMPDATAIGDTLDCGASLVQLQGNSNTPDVLYSWTGPNNFVSDEQNPEVTNPGEYFLTVLASNGCETTVSAMVEQDSEVPDVSTVGDTLNCAISIGQLQGNSTVFGIEYSWTGPSNFSSGEQNPEVTEVGVYVLTVIAPNGCSAISNAIVLGDFAEPDATALGDTLDCEMLMIQLQGNSTTPDATYSWTGPNNFESDDQNPEVTEPGEYFLTVIAQNGCETTTNAMVEQDADVPDATAIGDSLDCIVTIAQLQGNSTTPDVTFAWTGPNNFSTDEQNPEVTESGEYILTVTAPSGCSAMATAFVIEDSDNPDIAVITDTLSCINPIAQLQGNSTVPGVDYVWTGPNNFSSDEQNPQVADPGEYILTINAPNGCSSEMTIDVLDISELIIAELSSSDTITCENALAQISSNGSTVGSEIEYLWLDSENDSIGNSLQQNVTEGGFYTLIVSSNYSGCSAESEIFIEENTNLPLAEIDPVGSQSINCQNSSIVLSGEGSGPANEIIFEWFFGGNMFSNESQIQVDEAGEYVLQITNFVNGCAAFDTIIIDENIQLPVIEIIPPSELNCIDTQIQIDATNSSVGIEFDYQWISVLGGGIQSGASTLMPTINQDGEYVLIIENTENGCIDSSSVTVISNTELPIAEAGEAEDLNCDNPTAFLNGSGSSTGLNFNYLWTGTGILNGDSSLSPEVNQTGIFTLLVTNIENGCTANDAVTVGGTTDFVSGALVLATDPDCFGVNNGSIQVESEIGGEGPYLYSIDGQSFVQNSFFNGLSAGVYNLTVMDASGCEWDTLITLNFPTDISVNLGEDRVISLGDSINLDPLLNVSFSQIDTFFWQQNDPVFCDTCFNQWVTPFQTSTYSITVLNETGCRSTDEVTIRVEKNRLVYIPNAFSPNNDGTNDKFMIYGGKNVLKIKTFQIFNRWGAVVFERSEFQPDDPQNGWDGTYKGQILNPDVFVYFAEIEFIDGITILYKGDVTLFK